MSLFNGNKGEVALHTQEYETLYKRMIDFDQRLRRLELETDDFRDKVLRKIQRREQQKTEEVRRIIGGGNKREKAG